jgi:hypothetical protein
MTDEHRQRTMDFIVETLAQVSASGSTLLLASFANNATAAPLNLKF